MLNVERIRLFTAALRSGEYEQGTNRLHGDGRFCCLGVATEVAIANGLPLTRVNADTGRPIDLWYSRMVSVVAYVEGDELGESAVLPVPVEEWYGFAEQDPFIPTGDGHSVRATVTNDRLHWSFAQIADAFDALADAAEREQEEE